MTIYKPNTSTKQELQNGTPGGHNGDVLYDGAGKIINNFDSVYDTLGELRMTETEKQFLHSTGYYQTIDQNTTLIPGGMYTIDTTSVSTSILLTLPQIKKFSTTDYGTDIYAVTGNRIIICDSLGSWGTRPVIIKSAIGDTIVSNKVDVAADGTNSTGFYESYLEITLTAKYDSVTNNTSWNITTRSLVDQDTKPAPFQETFNDDTPTNINLMDIRSFRSVKYLVYAEEHDQYGNTIKTSTSEILLLSLPENKVTTSTAVDMPSTQYATVIWSDSGNYDDMYSYDFYAYYDAVTLKPTSVISVTSNVLSPNSLSITLNCIDVI